MSNLTRLLMLYRTMCAMYKEFIRPILVEKVADTATPWDDKALVIADLFFGFEE